MCVQILQRRWPRLNNARTHSLHGCLERAWQSRNLGVSSGCVNHVILCGLVYLQCVCVCVFRMRIVEVCLGVRTSLYMCGRAVPGSQGVGEAGELWTVSSWGQTQMASVDQGLGVG